MTAREFAEWIAYDSLAPFGERRADQRHAVMAWIMASANSTEKIACDAFLPAEITAEDEPEDEEEPWQAQMRAAEMITAAYGGKDMRQ
jgi:hypothetical protein